MLVNEWMTKLYIDTVRRNGLYFAFLIDITKIINYVFNFFITDHHI